MADTQPQQTNQNPQSGQPPAPDMTNATVTQTDTGVIVDNTRGATHPRGEAAHAA